MQFGLLTGKFNKQTRFNKNDHRHLRLEPGFLSILLDALEDFWHIADKYKVDKTIFALSFIINHAGVSTIIPGIKTPEQAEKNTKSTVIISENDMSMLHQLFDEKFNVLVNKMV